MALQSVSKLFFKSVTASYICAHAHVVDIMRLLQHEEKSSSLFSPCCKLANFTVYLEYSEYNIADDELAQPSSKSATLLPLLSSTERVYKVFHSPTARTHHHLHQCNMVKVIKRVWLLGALYIFVRCPYLSCGDKDYYVIGVMHLNIPPVQ